MANAVQDKSEALAVRIVNLWKFLLKQQEYDISRQVKRSGTSIGANVCEALYAASRKDFLNKMYIAYKELGETKYWLRVLSKTELITHDSFTSLYSECEELDHIIASIIKTTKENINNNNINPDKEEA
ncbi:MAG: four helix bundle protein [Bacteroidaceae bacterium]|nr:four helix bundle protein [Bacteroidaceae bacterium]MBP5630977.1 four helix bundle protein [Bacteroidaceae bacterium]